jgi:osmoprotectant transport system ATP-binding protein
MIELVGITKSYATLRALRSLDLKIPEGSITVLIGPSGCGKSTILRLIIGLIRPDSGRIYFDGKEVEPAAILELRRRIGYVIQEGGLFPHLTARGNVELMPRHLGWDKGETERRVRELAELCRFPAAGLSRYPAQLSGGERQRVSLMRALMLDPQLLLLDEPLGALDPMIRAELQEDLKRIFRTLGKTVLLVTHDLGEAAFFGDTIVLLHEGRVVQTGPPAELILNPADPFVTSFINAQRAPWRALQEDRS